jgi:phage baseplate assembly protein W
MQSNEESDVLDYPGSRTFLGKGWKFPVMTGLDLRIQTSSYEENIRESIMIILGTKKGERVMRPDFGCGINNFVFESINSLVLGQIKSSIVEALTRYEPRIELIDIAISDKGMNNGILDINISYIVISTNNRFNLVYPFYIREG